MMDFLRRLRFRFVALFRRRSLEADMEAELRAHLDMEADARAGGGMPPSDAHRAARRVFGGVDQIRERCREERRFVWLEQAGQDVRYAARSLGKHPGFAATIVAILAIGIGATTAIFSVVNGLVLKPLPYDEPGQLVRLFESPPPGTQNVVSPGVFYDWRERGDGFEGVAAYNSASFNFSAGPEPQRFNGLRMTANGLQLLRARPLLGRIFVPGEDLPGRANVIVLTSALWRRLFGADPKAVGRTLRLDDQPYTIVGVLPDGFLPFDSQQFVVPTHFPPDYRQKRDGHFLNVFARLKPGVSLAQAQAQLDAITLAIRPLFPFWKRTWSAKAVAMPDQLVQGIRPALFVLLGAVAMVLLIVCANVANLLLAKASVREREMAVRTALGASRGRIVRQLLTESLVLTLVGAALGILLAAWSASGLRTVLRSMNLPRVHEIAIDGPVLGLLVGISVIAGIGFGLVPALYASRTDLQGGLKQAAGGSRAEGNRLRAALIAGEMALALMLLVGAGLLLRSLSRLMETAPGFVPDHALSVQLSLSARRYHDPAARLTFYNRVADTVAALPGVAAAGLAEDLPLRGNISDGFFKIAGRPSQPDPGYDAQYNFCTPGYFRALGVSLLRGREFTAEEAARGAHVAIINATFARTLFPGEDPIGRVLQRDAESWEIIGVVDDVRMTTLSDRVRPLVYRIAASTTDPWGLDAALVVRTRIPAQVVVDSVREQMKKLDPSIPITGVRTLSGVVTASVAERSFTLDLLGGFAGVATLLAAIGLYGVVAHVVVHRRREFGIRAALGATGLSVTRLVLAQGMKVVSLGLVLGLAGALCLAHLLSSLLYGVRPLDPLTFGTVVLLLPTVALLASWLPARRAGRVGPMVALRSE